MISGAASEHGAGASVRVSVEFEEASTWTPDPIESFARAAEFASQNTPFLIASRPFFEASKAPDWFSGRAIPSEPPSVSGPGNSGRRLRCIKVGSETLLETFYDTNGRLASVCYLDGEAILCDWDDSGRSFRAHSRSGCQTEVEMRADGLPRSITYDGAQRFEYEYDHNANVTCLVYPDGMRVERAFGAQGRLSSVCCGRLRITFRTRESNDLNGYAIHDGPDSFEFSFQTKRHKCDLTRKASAVGLSSFPIVHPLGAWRISEQNALEEMLTPWGERFRVVAFGPNGPQAVWSSSGLQRFDYTAGGFVATTHWDGSRSMLYVLEGQSRALLVSPQWVTLLELDRAGRLSKARDRNGGYTLIDYTRDGKVKRVATFAETFSVFRDSRGLVSAIHSDSGNILRFMYSAPGELVGLVAEPARGTTLDDARRMLRFLW